MATFNGFTQKDFDVFSIPGLENRMSALREQISPKLEAIATELEPDVTALTGDEMFVHVAKHARRKTNPPNDTWAALASNKRGYKKLPHFQVGLWESHVFIWFAVIYESPIKQDFAKTLDKNRKEIFSQIPDHFVWSVDHTKPDSIPQEEVDEEKFLSMTERLKNVKKAEILCGQNISRDDQRLKDADAFLELCRETFEKLEPLYRYTKQLD
ncbi:YktB family protein [Halobacillus mangrovi]|uniref:YktB family protein n=1 Tax=Halobacillus mangrovi TaxID=402384 RepID=UPI003D959625